MPAHGWRLPRYSIATQVKQLAFDGWIPAYAGMTKNVYQKQ
jgi:hypothetical protein